MTKGIDYFTRDVVPGAITGKTSLEQLYDSSIYQSSPENVQKYFESLVRDNFAGYNDLPWTDDAIQSSDYNVFKDIYQKMFSGDRSAFLEHYGGDWNDGDKFLWGLLGNGALLDDNDVDVRTGSIGGNVFYLPDTLEGFQESLDIGNSTKTQAPDTTNYAFDTDAYFSSTVDDTRQWGDSLAKEAHALGLSGDTGVETLYDTSALGYANSASHELFRRLGINDLTSQGAIDMYDDALASGRGAGYSRMANLQANDINDTFYNANRDLLGEQQKALISAQDLDIMKADGAGKNYDTVGDILNVVSNVAGNIPSSGS